jgi:hypothetical protein
MTPHEQAAMQEKAAARAAVMAKWNDGSQVITDDDCKYLTSAEVTAAVNAGRIEGIGPDKRLRRR